MRIIPLGAGQEIGKSCILVQIKDKMIMLDCGLNAAFNDYKRYPDFSVIQKLGTLNCILISHFHLDHCGSLVKISQIFNIPIIATKATKELIPIMLEDLGDENKEDIWKSCSKIIGINYREKILIDDIEIEAYYAGHVLGGCMFHVKYGESLVYTGDFNTSADNHLSSASISPVKPDVLITECTYGLLIRDSRRKNEIEFLESIFNCLNRGGKVLIPIFAVGRAQEIYILIENFWRDNNINIPVFSTSQMTEKANKIYRGLDSYFRFYKDFTSFEFTQIRNFDRNYDGPMVVFASPGMLQSGQSLSLFKKWYNDSKNLIIFTGYCSKNSIGYKLLNNEPVYIDDQLYKPKIEIKSYSFSAHADYIGIQKILNQSKPKNVVLVHGEKQKMKILKKKLSQYNFNVYYPKNGEILDI